MSQSTLNITRDLSAFLYKTAQLFKSDVIKVDPYINLEGKTSSKIRALEYIISYLFERGKHHHLFGILKLNLTHESFPVIVIKINCTAICKYLYPLKLLPPPLDINLLVDCKSNRIGRDFKIKVRQHFRIFLKRLWLSKIIRDNLTVIWPIDPIRE